MLVITRKMNQGILIGDDIRVSVVGINGNHIRIGIDAPKKTPVARDEIKRSASRQDGAIRILHIEDSPADREIFRRALPERDFIRLLQVGTASEAIENFRLSRPDCVFLDYRLPDSDGISILQSLKPASGTPFVMLTGQGSESLAVAAMKSGASDYIVKDMLDRQVLRECMQSLGFDSRYYRSN